MAVRLETVQDLFDHKEWATCADLATRALAEGTWTKDHKALLNYILSRSQSNLDRYSSALEPGQIAVYISEEIRDYDLLGQSLIELAWIQHKIPGIAWQAVHTQRRYFDHFEKYGQPARRHYLPAMFNLGVYLRGAGDHEEALAQFQRAYEASKERRDPDTADLCRRNCVAEALQLGRVDLAAELIQQGQAYVERHPEDDRVNASHLIDQSRLLLLNGNHADATAVAIEAALRAKGIPELFADAFEVLHRVGKASGEIEGALAVALVAKIQAEKDEAFDLMATLRASVRQISVRHPDAVDRFMRDVTRLVGS